MPTPACAGKRKILKLVSDMLEKSIALQLREEFLAAMRTVANSVTVVTTAGPAGIHGATVSSFCSVSADPPTLLVCLNKDGSTGTAIVENKRFNINILPADRVETARTFAELGSDKLSALEGEEWISESGNPPALETASVFTCDTSQVIESTSHLVFIGEVVKVRVGEKEPLIYLNRQFRDTSKI